jgi:hypothetical protein
MQKYFNFGINDLKIKNRQYCISKLETGDLIKVKSEILPIIYHYGIIEKNGSDILIIHNHPQSINSKGGNVCKEHLSKFIKNRDIISVEKTNLKINEINKIYEHLKEYKYDFINFNCEHFVNFINGKRYSSSQVFKWTSLLAITALVYYLIKNKKI